MFDIKTIDIVVCIRHYVSKPVSSYLFALHSFLIL